MGEDSDNDSKAVINLADSKLFELRCLIKTNGICKTARCEIGRRQLLAFVTKQSDIGILYQSNADVSELPTIKRIPWFKSQTKGICALSFDPTGSWLLTACADGSLYIIPILALLDDGHIIIDHKWSINDVTLVFSTGDQFSYLKPSALTWWQGVTQNSHVGIIGTNDGEIIFINLENGQLIGSTRVNNNNNSITSLYICQDNSLEIVSLLITNKIQQQWRLILEQRTNGCIFTINGKKPYSDVNLSDKYEAFQDDCKILPPARSRLQGLKQLSVEKLTILKQKLAETRNRSCNTNNNCNNFRQDSEGSSSGNEDHGFHGFDNSKLILCKNDELILEPLSEDMFLSPQYTRQGQHLYTAYCAKSNHITIHGTDISVIPLHMYKMPEICRDILLTQQFFFIIGSNRQSLFIISCPLSEIKIGDNSEFNPESIIAKFDLESSQEVINNIYRVTDFKNSNDIKNDKSVILPKKIDDINLESPLIDSCLVVTNYSIYKVVLKKPLINVFVELALKSKRDIETAIKFGTIFGLDVPLLFEYVGDIHLSNNKFLEAATLYKLSKCRMLKGVLKTATTGHTVKLLGCLNHCLSPPVVSELTTTTRIHLSNLTVFAFSELILRASPQHASNIYKDFLKFLSTNTYYDERWVVDIIGQTCLWKVLHHLMTQRGLYPQVLEILIKTVQPYNHSQSTSINSTLLTPLQNKYGLLICISEPNLFQAILANPILGRNHISFVLSNLSEFQIFVLQRLVTLYDPTNPVFRPLLIRFKSRRRTTSHSSQSSQCDSLDSSDILEENVSLVEEIIETFILILLTLIHKRLPILKHNPSLIGHINLPGIERKINNTVTVDFKRRLLSAGYGHVALIRNGNIYIWGNTTQGRLGLGPSISKYGLPQPISLFKNMEMEILSVSCGRNHTLAVTNNGIYSWGSNQYGQLGLGRVLQTCQPELITSLAQEIIIDAVTGQYHSVGLTKDGRVFTWGWAVHGQLGHGDTKQKSIPTLVTQLLGVVIRGIAAGHAHTLTLSVDGKVYAFGCNIFGQLGTGNHIKSSVPQVVDLLSSEFITEITTGYFHNLAVTSKNQLYTWGSSPQVLRLQTQAQKKNKLLEFQAAAEKYNDTLDEFNPNDCPDDDNSLTEIEKLAIKTINERKINCCNVPKSISLRDINLGLLEETQTHLKPVLVDTSLVNGQIVQITTGCHHSTLLTKDGTVYCWGRNLDGQIGNGTRRDVNIPTPLTYNPVSVLAQIPPRNSKSNDSDKNFRQSESENGKRDQINRIIKAVRVCCGCEFTVAIQPGGTVLAWGSNSVAQLGRAPAKEVGKSTDKLVLIKSSKRVVRLPQGANAFLDTPSQVPNIPAPIITYQSYDISPLAGRIRPLNIIEKTYNELTLHYVLEQFNGLYDAGKIMDRCDELGNYQARSKLALLEHNYSISLAYQLKTLNPNNKTAVNSTPFMSSYENTDKIQNENTFSDLNNHNNNDLSKKMENNTELFIKQIEKNFEDNFKKCESIKKTKMQVSRSLDSVVDVMDQELYNFDCQGGSEDLCEDNKSEDISYDITDGALDNDNDNENNSQIDNESKDKNNLKDGVVLDALNVIKFYINEIDNNSQKTLQQILQLIFDFWIKNQLPMDTLESFLIENINKLFYSLGLLLFFSNNDNNCNELDISNCESTVKYSVIINYLSTNICLKICSMLLHYIDQGKPVLEYVELFSLLTTKNYGPSLNDCNTTATSDIKENKTVEQMMQGIISIISSKSTDPRPFIHIKDSDNISKFLQSDEDTVVFTCGHNFPISIYQSEIIPNMEAELLMSQPMPLPCTAQLLAKILSKTQIMCPICVPKAMQTLIHLID